jgi:hypothetical protein
MPDAWLQWNDDFAVSSTGGLLLAYGDDFAQQRIIRRLSTAVRGNVWHQDYGAGLLQKIGRPETVTAVTALVRSQMALESSVRATPAPKISVSADANDRSLFYIVINYTSAANGEPVRLTFSA